MKSFGFPTDEGDQPSAPSPELKSVEAVFEQALAALQTPQRVQQCMWLLGRAREKLQNPTSTVPERVARAVAALEPPP